MDSMKDKINALKTEFKVYLEHTDDLKVKVDEQLMESEEIKNMMIEKLEERSKDET
ncbi:hypothetical protein [Pseudobacillus badius]|uniref:hypothetical protein n=1 Tax=Bacillus badius TaxID=1455 RepID=UPI003D33E053